MGGGWWGWWLWGGLALAGGRSRWEPRAAQVEAYNAAVQALESSSPATAERFLRPVVEADPDCGVCTYTLGLALVRQQRPQEALALLEPLGDRYARADVFALTAVAAVAAGQPLAAREAATQALSIDPAAPAPRQILVRVLLQLQEPAAAQKVADEAGLWLSAPQAACLRAEVALAQEDLDDARAEVRACQSLDDPRTREEMALKLARAEGDIETIIQLAGDQQPELRNKAQAVRFLRAGDAASALPLIEQALARNVDDADALLLRALALQSTGDPHRARADLERLLGLSPVAIADRYGGLSELQGWRGLRRRAVGLYVALLIDDGRIPEARQQLTAAWLREGDGAPLHAAEVRLLSAEGQPLAAEQRLAEALARWPDDDDLALAAVALDGVAFLSPAHLRWLQARSNPGPLLQLATQRYHGGHHTASREALLPLRDHPDEAVRRSVRVLLHRCAIAAEDLPTAEATLADLEASGGAPSAEALLRHAWLLGEAGREDAALAMLAMLPPPLTTAQQDQRRSLQVWLLTRRGLLQEALALVAAGPVEPTQRADLAAALYEEGLHREARTLMQRACADMPAGSLADRCSQALSQMR